MSLQEPIDPVSYLSDRQLIAIDSIVAGNTMTEAAEHAGVSRATLYNWLKLVAFQAELNRRRAELHDHVNDLIRVADRSAMVQTANLIEDGDRDAIFTWIKSRGLGRVSTAPTGPTDVDEAIRAEAAERRDRMVERRSLQQVERHLSRVFGRLPIYLEAVEAYVRWEAAMRAGDVGDVDPSSVPSLGDLLASLDLEEPEFDDEDLDLDEEDLDPEAPNPGRGSA